jgi:hypothetical protein
MRKFISLLAGAACLGLAPAEAATVVDQTFTPTIITVQSAFTNGPTFRRAETLTVGVAGTLSEVDIQLSLASGFSAPVFTGFNILSTNSSGVPNTGPGSILGTGTLSSQTATLADFTTSLAVTVGEVIAIEPITSNNSAAWAGQNFPPAVSYTRGQDYFIPMGSSGPFLTSGAVDGFTTFVTTPQVPLPGALPLFATGLAGLGLLGWRRKRKAITA